MRHPKPNHRLIVIRFIGIDSGFEGWELDHNAQGSRGSLANITRHLHHKDSAAKRRQPCLELTDVGNHCERRMNFACGDPVTLGRNSCTINSPAYLESRNLYCLCNQQQADPAHRHDSAEVSTQRRAITDQLPGRTNHATLAVTRRIKMGIAP